MGQVLDFELSNVTVVLDTHQSRSWIKERVIHESASETRLSHFWQVDNNDVKRYQQLELSALSDTESRFTPD